MVCGMVFLILSIIYDNQVCGYCIVWLLINIWWEFILGEYFISRVLFKSNVEYGSYSILFYSFGELGGVWCSVLDCFFIDLVIEVVGDGWICQVEDFISNVVVVLVSVVYEVDLLFGNVNIFV